MRIASRTALVALALALLAWFTRASWLAPVVARLASRALGADVAIDELSTNGMSGLVARGVRVRAPDGAFACTVRGARARISPRRWLAGGADWIERVDVDGLDAQLDLARADRAPELDTEPEPLRWPEHMPEIAFSDAHLALVLPAERELELVGVALAAAPDGANARLDVARARVVDPLLGTLESPLAARFAFARGVLALDELNAGDRVLARNGRLDLTRVDVGVAALDAELPPLAARARVDRTRDALRVAAEFTQLELSALPEPLARALPVELAGRLSATVDALIPRAAPAAALARADVVVDAPCIAARSFDRFEAHVEWTGGALSIAEVRAQRGADRVIGRDIETPLVASSLEQRLRASRGAFEVELTDLPALFAPAREAAARAVPAHHVSGAARLDREGLRIERGELVTPGGRIVIAPSSLAWGDANAGFLSRVRVDAHADVELDDLALVGALVDTRRWSGSVHGRVDVSGDATQPSGELELRGRDIAVAGVELGDVGVQATVDAQRARVAWLEADTPYGKLAASGTLLVPSREIEQATLTLDVAELERTWPARFERGSAHVRARLSGALRDPEAELSVQAAGLRLRGVDIDFDELDARVRAHSGELEIDHLAVRSRDVEASLSGALATTDYALPVHVRVASFAVARGELDLALERPVEIDVAASRLITSEFALSGSAGRIAALVHTEPDRWNVRVDATRFDDPALIRRFLGADYEVEGANGSAELVASSGALEARASLAIARLRLPGETEDLALDARFAWKGARLSIESFALRGARQHLELSGSLPIDPLAWPSPSCLGDGALELRASCALDHVDVLPRLPVLPWGRLTGALAGRLELAGTWDAPRARVDLDAAAFEPDPERLSALASFGTATLRGHATFERELVLESFEARATRGLELDVRGALGLPFAPRAWLAREAPDLANIGVALRADARVPDLSVAVALLPPMARLVGRASGSLEAAGTLVAPDVRGTLALALDELRLPTDLPPLAAVDARVRFDGARATIEAFTGELGAGKFELGGTVGFGADDHTLDLTLRGKDMLLARTDHLRLRTDAELKLVGDYRGAPGSVKLDGELQLRDGRFSRDFDPVDSLRNAGRGRAPSVRRGIEMFSLGFEPFASAELAVRVTGDPIRIDSNLVQVELQPELKLSGSGRAPDLVGELYVARGALALPGGVVEIRAGTIEFSRRDPLVPSLDVSGGGRFGGYDVTLRARGPYDDLDVLLSSVPSLSSSDLLVLVLSGRVPTADASEGVGASAVQSIASFVGRDYLRRALQTGASDDESLWQRVEIRQGREITQSGDQTTEVSVRLGKGGRDSRRVISLRGEKDVYDRTNFGLRFLFRFP